MKLLVMIFGLLSLFLVSWFILQNTTTTPIVTAQNEKLTSKPTIQQIPKRHIISQKNHVSQTFNNCGPASLSMLLSYQNIDASQDIIGQKLRPYQNPIGDNDDKSVSMEELAEESKNYNLLAYHRPHGSLPLLKTLITNNIPILVRTWLQPNEDIGHFRIVRGYDDETKEIIQDDSYEGGNLRQQYDIFEEIWQPFNYEYMIVVKHDQKKLVEELLSSDADPQQAWRNAYKTAIKEAAEKPQNPYPIFNQSRALFHLSKYSQAQKAYESIQNNLPRRMLWYQIEPIETYLQMGYYEKVFTLTDSILSNENRGFSELYLLRGEAYKKQGNIEAARQEIKQAIYYNKNFKAAQDALQKLENL